MKLKIGVMGSAQGPTMGSDNSIQKAKELGKWIAKTDCILVNGACPGLPNEAAIEAKEAGGFVMGISPAFSEKEHVEMYKSPDIAYDVIIYTGLGLMERDIINIRSSDAIITVGGGIGTLNEFTVAYDEGKIVGILTGTGGISDHIPTILKMCNRKQTDRIIFDSDPRKLVESVVLALKELPPVIVEDERIVKG